MSRLFSLRIFSIGFALVYSWAVIQNVPAFKYYPLINTFSLTDIPDKTIGPAMNWYGWITYGILGGIVASVMVSLIARRFIDRLPVAVYWILTPVMLYAAWVREQDWFLK